MKQDREDTQDTLVRRLRAPTEPTEKLAPGQEKALLIAILGSEAGRTYAIEQETTCIGRSATAEICLTTGDVSREHARITKAREGQFFIEDLGSRNGTLVNGVFVQQQRLKFGDKIRIGARTLFVFTRYDSLEDQLLQIQRLESIGQLAGGVAHDFNNILGILLANVGFLRGLSPDLPIGDSNVKESLKDIETSAKRAVEVTRQLLSLSRKDEREQCPVEIKALVEEVGRLVSRTFDPSIQLVFRVEPDLLVSGDRSQLQQMLMNLCINARDAMPGGGSLSINCSLTEIDEEQLRTDPLLMPGPYVQLAVTDTGVGMSPETLRRVFEPFFTTKSRSEGTGLGLFTVFQIVRQHGGTIRAESEVGRGTTFGVFLPALAQAERRQPLDPNARKKTLEVLQGIILLVDDDEGFRKSTRRLLEGMGYPVKAVSSGVEAVRLFEQIQEMVELVMLDMVMPDMDGAETFDLLRKVDPKARVLIVSGLPDVSGARDLLARGAIGFLQKPYDAATLEGTIRRVLVT